MLKMLMMSGIMAHGAIQHDRPISIDPILRVAEKLDINGGKADTIANADNIAVHPEEYQNVFGFSKSRRQYA